MNEFLVGILNGINSLVNNYGWSIVVFTLLIKLVLFPFDYKSRKSMRRMTKLQPEIAKLQKKYANDKEKLNAKTSELYRKERINPLSGCVPMLITFPVLIAMFAAMRMIAQTELAHQMVDMLTGSPVKDASWLWVKNLWMPDSPFAPYVADLANLKQIPMDIWTSVWNGLPADKLSALAGMGLSLDTVKAAIDAAAAAAQPKVVLTMGDMVFQVLSQTPVYQAEMATWATMPEINLLITKLTIYAHCNGYLILPILAAVTQVFMAKTQPQAAPTADGQNPANNKFMKYFFPLFSLYLCLSYNAGFALYWVTSNLIAWGQGIVLNKVFEAQDKKQPDAIIGEGSVK